MATPQYILLYEYDEPVTMAYWLSAGAGLWFIVITPRSITITDDQSETGTYDYANTIVYNIKSLRANGIYYSPTESVADCLLTDSSFYYDPATTRLYVHFDDFEPPWGYNIFFGAATGFTLGSNETYYFNDSYYEPIISKIFSVSREKDAGFYGLLKFTSGNVDLINHEGTFDDWRSRNLYAQPSRILWGHAGDAYADLRAMFTGSMGKTSRTWEKITITNEDIRKRLTQALADNLLTLADYPDLSESNVDKPKPVAYGSIRNAPCICLNEEESTSTYTFLLHDAEWNHTTSLDGVWVEGVDQLSHATLSPTTGTFTLSSTYYTPGDNVTASFTVSPSNGVEIIKDIITNYDKKPYLNSFWNVNAVNVASAASRSTSIYVDDDKKVKEVIEQLCSDIDAVFFVQDDGRYSIRIYNADRMYSKVILVDDWIDEPKIDDNQDQFLTSAVIKYNHDIDNDEYYQYENKDYEATAYETYKTYNKKTIETGLTTEADAILKSQTILDYSSDVKDIITRSVKFETDSEVFYDIEVMDFIICDPYYRVGGTPDYKVYEILNPKKIPDKYEIELTMRYVKADPRTSVTYDYIVDGDGDFLVDGEGNYILGATAI